MIKENLKGRRFGRLIVQYEAEPQYTSSGNKMVVWHCKCDCGNEKDIRAANLKSGTMSCGCLAKEQASARRKRINQFDLSNQFGIGYTNKGEMFLFDIEDYDLIKSYCWRLRPDGYLDAKTPKTNKRIMMHNLIMNCRYIDHKNGIRHDNRKANLRKPQSEFGFDTYNQMNKSKQQNNKSGCAGVFWHKRDCIWEVHINVGRKQIYLGRYENYDDAVKVRKAAENQYFREWSFDNSRQLNGG